MVDHKDIRLLSICCTFRHPEKFEKMLSSFYATKSRGTELVTYLQEDDPFIYDYRTLLVDRNYVIGRHLDIVDCFTDLLFNRYPGIPYYHNVCDDYLYETSGWDDVLIEKLEKEGKGYGFSCGKDMYAGNSNWMVFKHPSGEVYSWKFVKEVGYLFPPGFTHFGPDYYLKEIGEATGGTIFCPDIIIRHCVESEPVYNASAVAAAFEIFKEWRKNDKERVLKIICKGRGVEFIKEMMVSPEGWE